MLVSRYLLFSWEVLSGGGQVLYLLVGQPLAKLGPILLILATAFGGCFHSSASPFQYCNPQFSVQTWTAHTALLPPANVSPHEFLTQSHSEGAWLPWVLTHRSIPFKFLLCQWPIQSHFRRAWLQGVKNVSNAICSLFCNSCWVKTIPDPLTKMEQSNLLVICKVSSCSAGRTPLLCSFLPSIEAGSVPLRQRGFPTQLCYAKIQFLSGHQLYTPRHSSTVWL